VANLTIYIKWHILGCLHMKIHDQEPYLNFCFTIYRATSKLLGTGGLKQGEGWKPNLFYIAL
jgi:hypothetical protein